MKWESSSDAPIIRFCIKFSDWARARETSVRVCASGRSHACEEALLITLVDVVACLGRSIPFAVGDARDRRVSISAQCISCIARGKGAPVPNRHARNELDISKAT